MKTLIIISCVLAFAFSAAIVLSAEKPPPFSSIPPKAAYELIKQNKGNPDFVLLDVRTSGEFEDGHIEGALNINYNSETFIDELKKLDRAKTYLIYCRTGRRSGDTLETMKKLGFVDVYRIRGDINAWKSAKLPLVK